MTTPYNFDSDFTHDDKNIYYKGKKLTDYNDKPLGVTLDPKHFRLIGDQSAFGHAQGYCTDGQFLLYKKNDGYNNYYFKVIKGADIESFHLLENHAAYAKDNVQAYYQAKIIKTKAVECFNTFENLKKHKKIGNISLYASDGIAIYHQGFKISGADVDSFEQISSDYNKDNNSIFYGRKRLADCDVNTAIVDGRDKEHFHKFLGGGGVEWHVAWDDRKFHYITDKNGIWDNKKALLFSEDQLLDWKGFFLYYKNLKNYWWHRKGGLDLPKDHIDEHYDKVNINELIST